MIYGSTDVQHMNLSNNTNPSDPPLDAHLRTPWDDLDTDPVVSRAQQQNPIPSLSLNDIFPVYLSVLPIGSNGHISHWQDQWNACRSANCYRRHLQAILQYENATAQKVSGAVQTSVPNRPRQNTVDEVGNLITSTIEPRKRARESDADKDDRNSPAKRLRISDISPPPFARTRSSATRDPATSPETRPIAFDYASSNAHITFQVRHTHNHIIAGLDHLLGLVVQAENIEGPTTACDFRSSAMSDDLAERLTQLEEQARVFGATLDNLALELKGWTTVGNVYDHNFGRKEQSKPEAELEKYYLTLEKGPLQYWLERGHQAVQIWEDEL